jgi:metallophosphoesterase superfamily enzyme
MKKLIKYSKPDLVIITGDIVSGFFWDKSQGFFRKHWRKFKSVFEESNIPYMFMPGNHDSGADLNI